MEDPVRDAALTEPTDAAQPVPKLPAAGEVTDIPVHCLCTLGMVGKGVSCEVFQAKSCR